MFKKFKERRIHAIIIAFFIGIFAGVNVTIIASSSDPSYKYLDYFHKTLQIIKTKYVEVPDNKKLFYGAMRGMIKSTGDPFSRFLDERSKKNLREMTSGKFIGVGIQIASRNGEIMVISPMDGSPAMKAGIKAGDVIVQVNKTKIKGKKLMDIVKMIKGLPNSVVNLKVRREGFNQLLDFSVERAPIKIASVSYGIMKEAKIGYIHLKVFNRDSTRDIKKALTHFNKNNVSKCILDLRNNPGGILRAAKGISDFFLDQGKTIVSTKGREGVYREVISKAKAAALFKGTLIILVNKGSASASEIVAGAIRDNKRGKLLGEKTFGKGSVQGQFDLDENIGIALTIAKYYTPSGESIHMKGIKPDYKVLQNKMSDTDKTALRKIYKAKLLDSFVKPSSQYNQNFRKQFIAFLDSKNIKISKRTSDMLLKNAVYRYKKRPLYDMEFDKQLQAAVGRLK